RPADEGLVDHAARQHLPQHEKSDQKKSTSAPDTDRPRTTVSAHGDLSATDRVQRVRRHHQERLAAAGQRTFNTAAITRTSSDRMRMAANTPAVSYRADAFEMRNPIPRCDEMNSATIAPIT